MFDVTNIKCLDKLIEVSDLHRFFFGFFTSLIFISPLVGLLLIISCFKGILINVLYILTFPFFIAPFFSFQGLSKKNNINLSFLNSCIENIYLQKIINDNKPEIILYYLVSLIFIFSFFSLSLEDKHQFLYYFNNNIFYLTSIFLILPMVNLKRQMESEMTFVLGKIKENWIMIFVISWIIGPIFILNALIFKDLNLITMFLSVIFCYSLYIFKRDGFTYFLVMFGGSLIIMLL